MTFVGINRKLRSTVRKTVRSLPPIDQHLPPDYEALIDSTHSNFYRLVWFCIVIFCFTLCCYQIIDRVQYYLSVPTAVDIQIDALKSFKLPPVKICSPENDYIVEKLQKEAQREVFTCALPLLKIWKTKEMDYSKVWEYKNQSILKKLEVFHIDREELNIGTVKTIFGQCNVITLNRMTGKQVKVNVKVSARKGKLCDPTILLASLDDRIQFGIIIPIIGGRSFDILLGFRKYMFGSTPDNPCTSEEEYTECYKSCLLRRIAANATCSLPFFDKSINLPPCTSNDNERAGETYNAAVIATLIPKVDTECKCPRSCNQNIYTAIPTIQEINPNDTTFVIAANQIEVSLTQRLAYDINNLLTDIGGTLSLFMGLSLLAIINIFQTILVWIRRKRRVKRLRQMESYIFKLYCEFVSKQQIQQRSGHKIDYLWCFALLASFSLATFMIYHRTVYYFQFATRNVVGLEYQSHVRYPSLTLCGVSESICNYKKWFFIENQSTLNITNWCDVELLDLYDKVVKKKKLTAEKLWTSAKLRPVTIGGDLLESLLQMKLPRPNESIIPTHRGNCPHFKFQNEEYLGLFTIYILPFIVNEELQFYECKNAAFDVYISDTESTGLDRYDEFSKIPIPIHSSTANDFRITKFHRLNIPRNPCVDKSELMKCRKKCLVDQLEKANLCKLPFLDGEINNLVPCKSSASAKETLKRYLLISSNITSSCFCTRACHDTGYFINSYSVGQPKTQPFAIVFTMLSNIAEQISEVRVYSLIALCADVGNSFGLALGMCVLSFARYAGKPLSLLKLEFKWLNKYISHVSLIREQFSIIKLSSLLKKRKDEARIKKLLIIRTSHLK